MAVPRSDGRVNQRRRTRAAIVDAAARLLADGTTPTVAQAAEAALVSRTTAYRYFPTQDALLYEVTLNASVDTFEALVAEPFLDDADADDATIRALDLLRRFETQVFAEEARFRTGLKLYLDRWFDATAEGDDDPVVREGRRRRWFAAALDPIREDVPTAEFDRLVDALSLLVGAEPMVVLRDICRRHPEDGIALLEWIARTLIKETLR